MVQVFPKVVFFALLCLLPVKLCFALGKKRSTAETIGSFSMTASGAGVFLTVLCAGRPPLFGAFEGSIFILFILALLEKTSPKKPMPEKAIHHFLVVHSATALLLLALQLTGPIALNTDYYMYDNFFVIVFFNFRLLAAAVFIHAALLSLTGLLHNGAAVSMLPKHARFILLAGSTVYLTSEWAGSFWALNWFGDAWRWSHGFFEASILFLLVMLACHLPASIRSNTALQSVTAMLPAGFAVWMIFWH